MIISFPFQTNSDNDIAPEITFEKEPPPTEWHIAACNDIERFDILTVRLICGYFLLASLIMNFVTKNSRFCLIRNQVSQIKRDCNGFASIRAMIGLHKNSCAFSANQMLN